MRIVSNTSRYCRVSRATRKKYPINKAHSGLSVFFNFIFAIVIILMSAKMLSLLETSLTNSIEPVSAATYQDTIAEPYHYTEQKSLETGALQLGDLDIEPIIEEIDNTNDTNTNSNDTNVEDLAEGLELSREKDNLVAKIRSWLIPTAHAAELDISAQLISVSASEITIAPGKAITIEAKFKNTGNYTWTKNNYNFVALATVEPTMRYSDFQHKFWEEYFRVARISEKSVAPGAIATVRFAIEAPTKAGEYIEKFQLVARRLDWIEGGEITLYINVGNVAKKMVHKPVSYEKTPIVTTHIVSTQYNDQNNPTPNSNINNSPVAPIKTTNLGPTMRVGLYDTKMPVSVVANGDYYIKDATGKILATKKSEQGTSASFDWMNKNYIVSSDNFHTNTKQYIRFELADPANSFFTITSYDARPSFNPKVNYNDFRYILELRYTPATKKLWVINELPMEKYLLGISETQKYAPIEFLKAMAISARTYGMYHQERQTKHATEYFTVDSKYDQVYRGAAIEDILTDYKTAVEATNGLVVTYDDKIAITPYFASSDGRTRSFAEVWYNEVPWLQSVTTEYEPDGTLKGHGVGLSAVDAHRRAKAGASYDEILNHYYTGITIKTIY
jgi:peptidoglycan hydrolase-like amidase